MGGELVPLTPSPLPTLSAVLPVDVGQDAAAVYVRVKWDMGVGGIIFSSLWRKCRNVFPSGKGI